VDAQAPGDHQYMIATSVRMADVFVPGPFSRNVGGVTVTGSGVWRTILLFGRGAGGHYLTALDVTTPAPFTAGSLATAPPLPLWSRGNPDTEDGSIDGGDAHPGSTDRSAYRRMGQTWSVPAIARVDPVFNRTARKPVGVEYVAYVGSGYG